MTKTANSLDNYIEFRDNFSKIRQSGLAWAIDNL